MAGDGPSRSAPILALASATGLAAAGGHDEAADHPEQPIAGTEGRPHGTLAATPDERAQAQALLDATIAATLPFHQTAGRPLTAADQRLYSEFTTAILRADFPDDRRVPFSLGEAARVLGHEELGGKQRAVVRRALTRLRACTIESAVRLPDGHEETHIWGLLDEAFVTTRGGGRGWVIVSTKVVHLLNAGSVTWLHAPTWDAIAARDHYAARLWTLLETENLREGWRFPLFSDEAPTSRSIAPIADLLRIDWRSRKKVALRLREACKVICAEDTRYRLSIEVGRQPGTLNLRAYRGPHVARRSRPKPNALPAGVVTAWRRCYAGRQPSAAQEAVLREIVDRQGADWVVSHFRPDVEDPYRATKEADVAARKRADAEAERREREWAAEKAQHQPRPRA